MRRGWRKSRRFMMSEHGRSARSGRRQRGNAFAALRLAATSTHSLPSWIKGSSCLVLRSTARTMVRSSMPSGDGGDGGDDLPAVRQAEAHGEGAVGPQLDRLALQGDAGVGFRGAVDDQFGVQLEPELPRLAARHQAAGAEAGHGRRVQRATQPFLEQLLELQAAADAGRVEAAGHGVDAVGLLGVDVGPVFVDHVADAGPRRGDDVGTGQDVEPAAAWKGSRCRRGRSAAGG